MGEFSTNWFPSVESAIGLIIDLIARPPVPPTVPPTVPPPVPPTVRPALPAMHPAPRPPPRASPWPPPGPPPGPSPGPSPGPLPQFLRRLGRHRPSRNINDRIQSMIHLYVVFVLLVRKAIRTIDEFNQWQGGSPSWAGGGGGLRYPSINRLADEKINYDKYDYKRKRGLIQSAAVLPRVKGRGVGEGGRQGKR